LAQGQGHIIDATVRLDGVTVKRSGNGQWLADIAHISLRGCHDEVGSNIDGKVGLIIAAIISKDNHLAIGDLEKAIN